MANLGKTTYPVRCVEPGTILMPVLLTGSGTPASIPPIVTKGRHITCTRGGLGDYVLTISGTGTIDIQGVQATLLDVGVTDLHVRVDAFSNSARTVTLQLFILDVTTEPAVPVGLDLTATEQIHVAIYLKESGV